MEPPGALSALLTVAFLAFSRTRTAAAFPVETPPLPSDFIINQTTLSWNSTARDATFNVEYRKFGADWKLIETCANTSVTRCDFGREQASAEFGCVQLRVAAQGNGITSEPVEVCSRDGNSCSPSFNLTASPGSLTVNLKRNHILHEKNAAHLTHGIYLGKKGGVLESYSESFSSKLMDNLEVGQQYCVKVEFLLHGKPLGPVSCEKCETIPDFGGSKPTQIAAVCVVVLLVLVFVGVAYVRLFKFKKIKQALQPPYTMPEELLSRPKAAFLPMSLSAERYDLISSMTPIE